MLVVLRLRLRIFVYRCVEPPILVRQRRKQIEAAACQRVVAERAGIGQRLEIKVADPQALVTLGAVLVDGLHTLRQRFEPRLVDTSYHRVGPRSQSRRLTRSRRHRLERDVAYAEVEIGGRQHLYLDIAACHTPLDTHLCRQSHDGNRLVLKPRAAQPSRIGVEGGVQLGRHLGEGQAQTNRGVGRHTRMVYAEREVPCHVPAHVHDHRLPLLERRAVQCFDRFGVLHAPPLKSRRIGHTADNGCGMPLRTPQLGHSLGRLAEPPAARTAHPYLLLRRGRYNGKQGRQGAQHPDGISFSPIHNL